MLGRLRAARRELRDAHTEVERTIAAGGGHSTEELLQVIIREVHAAEALPQWQWIGIKTGPSGRMICTARRFWQFLTWPRPGWPTRRTRQRIYLGMIISGVSGNLIILIPSYRVATVVFAVSMVGVLATVGVAAVQILTGHGVEPRSDDASAPAPRTGER